LHERALAAFRGLLTGIRQNVRTHENPVDDGRGRPANSRTLTGHPSPRDPSRPGTSRALTVDAVRLQFVEVSMTLLNRRWWFRIGLGLLGMLLAIQLVPYGRDHDNPPVMGEPTWDSPETRALARQACFDCHSNETQWPAYAHIAPASWLVQRDVNEGRAVLNFSEWPRPQNEAKEASETVLKGEMPPIAYTLVHAHARLNVTDRDRLARGLAKTVQIAPVQEAHERNR